MPFNAFHLARLSVLRHIVVWVLVLALPVHGLSNVLLTIMGASHRHQSTMVAADGAAALADSVTGTTLALRHWAASLIGVGALSLIDAKHARDAASQHTADLKNQPFAYPAMEAFVSSTASTKPLDGPDSQDDASQLTKPQAAHQQAVQQAHQHAHDTFQRHIHDPQDGSVVVLGDKVSGSDAQSSAPALDMGSSNFPLPALMGGLLMTPSIGMLAWEAFVPNLWHSLVLPPLERPPQR